MTRDPRDTSQSGDASDNLTRARQPASGGQRHVTPMMIADIMGIDGGMKAEQAVAQGKFRNVYQAHAAALNAVLAIPEAVGRQELSEEQVMNAINRWRSSQGTLREATDYLNALLRSPAPEGQPQIEFTLAQANALVDFFASSEGPVIVAKHDGKLLAWFSEYPEEGSIELIAAEGQPRQAEALHVGAEGLTPEGICFSLYHHKVIAPNVPHARVLSVIRHAMQARPGIGTFE